MGERGRPEGETWTFSQISNERIEALVREHFRFLEDDHGFHATPIRSTNILAGVDYVRGGTLVTVSWDVRENILGVDFYRVATQHRVLLDELVAIAGGPVSEVVHAPEQVTVVSADDAIERLAALVRKHGGGLLDDDWSDIVERVRGWASSGAWRTWRDGI